jgi:hypothetical protein
VACQCVLWVSPGCVVMDKKTPAPCHEGRTQGCDRLVGMVALNAGPVLCGPPAECGLNAAVRRL